ncbi:hypothetical protein [Legionella yabuuchiae]|uniref:hypothetical protein n=1 Tax=Legionella yabuuchiae TaxID=376727 RepID=UPI0010567964|nr:hypothetical protein [Legionella yabuuchiae]
MKQRLDELREKERRSQLEEQELRELMLKKRSSQHESHQYTLRSGDDSTETPEEFQAIIDDYMSFVGEFAKERPEAKGGLLKLDFPTPENAVDFFQQQASKSRSFIIFDEQTKKVLAYSNGDGQLHHGNGKPFQKDDKLTRSEIDYKDFHMPSPDTMRP